MRNDSVSKTLIVATSVCVVCSILVSAAAVNLRPKQRHNREVDRQRNILEAADLYREGVDVERTFRERIEARLVDLESGELVPGELPEEYDQRSEARNPETSVRVPAAKDLAGVKSRAKRAPVYFVKEGDLVRKLILPIHGQGLWSTMYGFIALDTDTRTILGLTFYEHGETPGLGGEVDNPRWKRTWVGKLAFDEQWRPAIEVVRGAVQADRAEARYQVDGLSGATITARGVTNAVRYWISDHGYGSFLEKFRTRGNS